MIYRFGRFELDAERYLLARAGTSVEIEPRVFEVLRHLIAAGGGIVTKDELVEAVWGGRSVSDAAVTRAVQKGRRVLEDGAPSIEWITTVHGRGYRFSNQVEVVDEAAAAAAPSTPAAATEPALPITVDDLVPSGATAATVRPTVAVLPLRNLGASSEWDWIGIALAELVAVELAADGAVRMVPGQSVATLARDLPLSGVEALDRATLDAVRALLGADFVVTGSYLPPLADATASIRANVALRAIANGEARLTAADDAALEDLATLATRLAARLRAVIGGPITPSEPRAWRLLPAGRRASRLYVEGVALLRRGESSAGHDRLEQAVAEAPSFALGHAALASALRELGYEARSREAAERARRLGATLPREQRLLVEGLRHECERDRAAAAQSYTALWKFFPDDLEYGLLLVRAQVAASSAEAASATIQALRELPPPSRDDPRLDLAEAEVAAARSDPSRMRELAVTAARKAAAKGARRLEAQAVLAEGKAWRYLGDFARAVAGFRRAGELYAAAGDDNGVAEAMQRRGASLFHHGDWAEAEALVREAHDRYMSLGRPGAAAICRLNLGMLNQERGDLPTAARLYREALAVFRELGDREFTAQCLMGLNSLHYSQGEMEAGLAVAREGLAFARASRNRRNEAELLVRMGDCLHMLGRLAEAADAIEQSLAASRDAEYPLGEAQALNALGTVRSEEGNLAEAARLHLEALARYRRLEDAYRTGDALNRAANVRYAQGHLALALELHRESLAINERIGHRFGVGIASYGIAADLFALGRLEEAEPRYRIANDVARELGNRVFSAETRRGLAELEVARGELAAARQGLQGALEDLRSQTSHEIERNVRLLLARIDLEEGAAADAERDLRRYLAVPPAPLDADSEAALRDLLAQALLEQGRLEEARGVVRRALALTERSQRHQLRLGIEITSARVTAAMGDAALAAADLVGVVDRARELDLASRRLEAELALAEVRLRTGGPAAGQAAFDAVAREAAARGLRLLVDKASFSGRRGPHARGGEPA